MAPSIVPDPTLPAPWQKLYDDASDATYYWNPNTNVTTYQRPEAPAAAPPPVSARALPRPRGPAPAGAAGRCPTRARRRRPAGARAARGGADHRRATLTSPPTLAGRRRLRRRPRRLRRRLRRRPRRLRRRRLRWRWLWRGPGAAAPAGAHHHHRVQAADRLRPGLHAPARPQGPGRRAAGPHPGVQRRWLPARRDGRGARRGRRGPAAGAGCRPRIAARPVPRPAGGRAGGGRPPP
jgi:hypothetical protein